MDYIIPCVLEMWFIVIGVITYRGNIAYIHWYNRFKVTKENTYKFAKVMGRGAMVIDRREHFIYFNFTNDS